MKHLRSLNRKAFFEIMGAFFLILMLIVVTLGITFYQQGFLVVKAGINNELGKYAKSFIVRDKLFACYGNPINSDHLKDMVCLDEKELNIEILEKIIRGYEIEQEDLFGCSKKTWGWNSTIRHEGLPNEYVYYVPVHNTTTNYNCLAKLKIIT